MPTPSKRKAPKKATGTAVATVQTATEIRAAHQRAIGLRLRRVELGPLHLGSLASGKWRALTDAEITNLKTSLGLD